MRWNRVLAGLGVMIAALFAYAWIDGGKEPPRAFDEPVALPGAAR